MTLLSYGGVTVFLGCSIQNVPTGYVGSMTHAWTLYLGYLKVNPPDKTITWLVVFRFPWYWALPWVQLGGETGLQVEKIQNFPEIQTGLNIKQRSDNCSAELKNLMYGTSSQPRKTDNVKLAWKGVTNTVNTRSLHVTFYLQSHN